VVDFDDLFFNNNCLLKAIKACPIPHITKASTIATAIITMATVLLAEAFVAAEGSCANVKSGSVIPVSKEAVLNRLLLMCIHMGFKVGHKIHWAHLRVADLQPCSLYAYRA
jgi:hypothetical protein